MRKNKGTNIIRYGVITVLLIGAFVGGLYANKAGFFASNQTQTSTAQTSNTNTSTQTQGTADTQNTASTATTSTDKANETEIQKYVPVFKLIDSQKDPEEDMATKLKKSVDGKLQAQLDGRGVSAEDEGVAEIFIKSSANKKWRLQLTENDENFTPRYLTWLDNENLLVTMCLSTGHASYGGSVYKVNVNTGKAELVYEVDSSKRQVRSMTVSDTEIKMNVIVFTDDVQNQYKEEVVTIKR